MPAWLRHDDAERPHKGAGSPPARAAGRPSNPLQPVRKLQGDDRKVDVPAIEIIPIAGIGEVAPGDNLAGLLSDALTAQGRSPRADDVLVVTQKLVSKAERWFVVLAWCCWGPRRCASLRSRERIRASSSWCYRNRPRCCAPFRSC